MTAPERRTEERSDVEDIRNTFPQAAHSVSRVVLGPEWSLEGLQVAAGRFPLGVEQHILRMSSLLVPGATTVTPHGRYYALHALAAVEAGRKDLGPAESMDLLRRMEVVMAGVSVLHEQNPDEHSHWPRPHGADVISPSLRATGTLDIAQLSKPGSGYVKAQSGYWAPYAGSEYILGIVSAGGDLRPGDRCDASAVRAGLGELVDLAQQDQLGADALASRPYLCLCGGRHAQDGLWLRRLLCNPPAEGAQGKADRTRRATSRLLAQAVGDGAEDFATAFSDALAFGPFTHDNPVAAALDEALAWRGVILRNYSVAAWRRLWAWLVDQVDELISAEELAETFADHLPDRTVAAFVAGLPDTTDSTGTPRPAENELRASQGSIPATEVAVLAVGARRVAELDGRAGEAFRGRPVELAPEWMARRLQTHATANLRDFGRALVGDLVVRARRIAMSKMVRRPDGTIWLPTRLHEKGDLLWRTSREGSRDVGLRIAQLGTVLAGAGVFAWTNDEERSGWRVTEEGEAALV